MRCHLVSVGVAPGLVPTYAALKETLNRLSVVNLSCVATLKFAQFSLQCLEISRSSSQPRSIDAVLCVQRLSVHLSASVRVVCEAEVMSSSANAMKVRKPEPAEIEYKNMKFLITYRPTDATMDRFIEVSPLFSTDLQWGYT